MTRHRRSIAVVACALGAAIAAPAASGARGAAIAAPAASGAGAVSHKPKPVVKKVRVSDNFYSSTKLGITKGSAVNWVWSATNFNTHNVTLIKGPKGIKKSKFTSISGSRGLHFKRTFTTPGTYHFECTIHTSMNITVTVKR